MKTIFAMRHFMSAILAWVKRNKIATILSIFAVVILMSLTTSLLFVDVRKSQEEQKGKFSTVLESEIKFRKVRQTAPSIRLFINNGSERSDYMPQEKVLQWLGVPHSGVNLMACYYPRQSFWPQRKLFSKEIPHYRHSIQDQTETTKLADINDWTDGYYSFDINNPHNDVVRQMEDVRRFGQDVRLTLTADIDTSDTELERIAEILKDFGPLELRLNHEASGNKWFRFAQNVGTLTGEKQRQLYYDISQFFIKIFRLGYLILQDGEESRTSPCAKQSIYCIYSC